MTAKIRKYPTDRRRKTIFAGLLVLLLIGAAAAGMRFVVLESRGKTA